MLKKAEVSTTVLEILIFFPLVYRTEREMDYLRFGLVILEGWSGGFECVLVIFAQSGFVSDKYDIEFD